LAGVGACLNDVTHILLTHLDRDHFKREWRNWILKRGVKLFCHQRRRHALAGGDSDLLGCIRTFHDEPFQPVNDVTCHAIPFSHDLDGSHGFVIESNGTRLGYATDLGHVPRALIDGFARLHILAIESNYDPDMQLQSARPDFLKRRIMNGHGHLSNAQAYAALRTIFDQADALGHRVPDHIVLLHRSRQCNCPILLKSLFDRDPRIASRVTLAEQHQVTPWMSTRTDLASAFVGQQLQLAFAEQVA